VLLGGIIIVKIWRQKIKKILVLFLFTAIFFVVAGPAAGAPSSIGNEFWLMFPQNYDGGGGTFPSLIITGQTAATGTVTIPGMSFTSNFSVTPGSVTTVNLPQGAYVSTDDGVQQVAIHVTASAGITVYGMWYYQYTTDAFLALPVSAIGTSNMVMAYNAGSLYANEYSGPQLGIAAAYNNTIVTITPSCATLARAAGVPYSITMNQGDAYQLFVSATASDLTGTLISSTQPIAVFGSNRCANVPSDQYYACNYIIEQMPPVPDWGKNFFTVPLDTRSNGDTFRILSSADGTNVQINGASVATLNTGQFYQTELTTVSNITASEPVLVAQYSNCTSYDGDANGDPSMMLIFPVEQYLNSYTVSTPASNFLSNYINVIVDSADAGNVILDGTAIPASSFSVIGATGYSGAAVSVGVGTHNLSSVANFGINVYGFAQTDAYSYPGGGAFANLLVSPTMTPTWTSTSTASPTYTITATYTPTLTVTQTCTVTVSPTPVIPLCLTLYQNSPNPCSNGTNIIYQLCCFAQVNIKIYTISGEVVKEFSQQGQPGVNSIYWDTSNNAGRKVTDGVFIYRIEATDGKDKKKAWGKMAVTR